ncbi:MAG TPA: tRNA (adenosine(37)-N6)-threonylcarbamoyltransferase complex transferase subunit TsaD [Fimbriimonadales bacterium]|nr:tRNA (adenosine(37)-N6)-threonylcarbamoyltransferase complex transferase subunit TsaD [Fimbriimonadales bacterium]
MEYLDGIVLGIETSCDETSCALVRGREVLSNVVSSQAALHMKWGGVVPEVAARKHTEALLPALERAFEEAHVSFDEIRGIGVTNRPGLVGALAVGVAGAKALSLAWKVPMLGVHHLEAHILSPLMAEDVPFPHVCLLVSGGHTELILVRGAGMYEKLGGTIDDAAGEAFDKCARAMGLGFPGGPAIQKIAEKGDPHRYKLPRGLSDPNMNFSFAGLKTAVLKLIEKEKDSLDVPSLAASFEEVVTSVLAERTFYACKETNAKAVTLVGGVAANRRLRSKMDELSKRYDIGFFAAPLSLCTDNAAMIAHVAAWRLSFGERDDLDMETLSSAPLPGLQATGIVSE